MQTATALLDVMGKLNTKVSVIEGKVATAQTSISANTLALARNTASLLKLNPSFGELMCQ